MTGQKLDLPSKGDKGNLKFDITSFKGLLVNVNSEFTINIKDNNGKKISAVLKLKGIG